jgi:uncharacterized protein (DUF2147 family)
MNKFTIIMAAAVALTPVPSLAATPLEGTWTNPKRTVTVRIAPCGATLCGRVVNASAKARRDAAEGGTRNLVGATILKDLRPAGANRWRGQVFMPKANRHAGANLHLAGNRLTVQGCILGVICKDQTWSRVS